VQHERHDQADQAHHERAPKAGQNPSTTKSQPHGALSAEVSSSITALITSVKQSERQDNQRAGKEAE